MLIVYILTHKYHLIKQYYSQQHNCRQLQKCSACHRILIPTNFHTKLEQHILYYYSNTPAKSHPIWIMGSQDIHNSVVFQCKHCHNSKFGNKVMCSSTQLAVIYLYIFTYQFKNPQAICELLWYWGQATLVGHASRE